MLRIVFFGMNGLFSMAPLEQLIRAGVEVVAVVVPVTWPTTEPLPRRLEPRAAGSSDLPVINSYIEHNIVHIAWEYHIPVWEVGTLANKPTLELLSGLRPDLITVACFPHIFPPALLQLPPYGCLNLHPSLLPAYRGPAPLFWMARNGEQTAGVTLHFLNEGIDSGDIVNQTSFAWPDGVPGKELDRQCSNEGARLLAAAVRQLKRGEALPRSPQPREQASYYSWPAQEHFRIPTSWQARHAFNFLRAAGEWPLIIDVSEERYFVRSAIGYAVDQNLGQPYIRHNDELWVQFNPGVLQIQI